MKRAAIFFELSEWLQQNLAHFDFTLPFTQLPQGKEIGYEPWHISYLPVADLAKQQFSAEILLASWQNEDIAGKACLTQHLDEIFQRFFI